jgi:hypothetical protein
MVNQLDKYWDVSSWPQRYQYSSFDLNYIIYDSLSVDYHEEFELDLCEFEDNLKQVLTQ